MRLASRSRSTRTLALLAWFAATPFAAHCETGAQENPACKTVESVGAATMSADGTITVRIRSLPPGPIAEGQFTYEPTSRDYDNVLKHLGGLHPGETKPVRPWC